LALGVTDLKKGVIFEWEDQPFKVIEYAQKVMGRGGSIVNVKIKSLITGQVLEKTFKGSETLEQADVVNGSAQFLYSDSESCYFMDSSSYETHKVSNDIIGPPIAYLKEGEQVQTQSFNGQVVSVELPKNVYLEVEYTEQAVKGDTSSAITKDAKLETGAVIKVPAFIKVGDKISVDTTTGNYRERLKE
jgi:elongation factor P